MNHLFKSQYNVMKNKMNKKDINNEKENGEIKISNLKNQNKKLQIDIRKYKDEDVSKKKDVKKIVDNIEIPNEMKIKSEEIRKLTSHKHECYSRIKMGIKSLENVIKEIDHLEEMSKKKYKEDGDENLNNKINFWIDLIRSDLNGNQEEILSKIEKNETNFLKEINRVDLKNKNNNDKKNSSFIENQKENNLEISYNLKSNKEKNNIKNLKNSYKGIFGKFNYLKQNPISPIRYKLTKKNISSEEKKMNKNIDMDIIIEKDYEDTTDSEYRELLDKKSQYLETNMRLEKNIREIERTKKSKLLNVSYTIQENDKRLRELKSQNDLLEQEIINLQNLYKLTIEKERLKKEIKDKKKTKIIIEDNNKDMISSNKLTTSLDTENKILNKLRESNDTMKNIEIPKKIIKNRSGYRDDFISEKSVIESREERLKKIRAKYLDENENEEINENKTSNEEIKENKIKKDKNKDEIMENKNNDITNKDDIMENKNDDISNKDENNEKNEEQNNIKKCNDN